MRNRKTFGFFALLLATLIWGTSFVILKTTLDEISVLWVLAIRFLIATFLFGIIILIKHKRIDREHFIGGILMGLTMAAAYLFQTYGLYYTSPGKNAFLTASYCVLVPFLAWLIYKRKPNYINIIAAFVCFLGIGLISLSDGLGTMNKGDILTLFCGIFYGLQLIIISEYVKKCDVTVLSFVEFSTSAILFLVAAMFFEKLPSSLSGIAILKILYMGFICTGLCFFLQAWGQQYTSSSATAVIMPLESVFGALVSYIFYNENFTIRFIIGAIFVSTAIVLNELKSNS